MPQRNDYVIGIVAVIALLALAASVSELVWVKVGNTAVYAEGDVEVRNNLEVGNIRGPASDPSTINLQNSSGDVVITLRQ